MRPGEVLDAQADLIERLGSDTVRKAFTLLVAHHLGHMPTYDEPTPAQRREVDEYVERFSDAPNVIRNHVRAGCAYRVTHEMCQMVEWTASQLEDTDAFYRELLPSECGIVCFDKPLPLQDIRGRTMLTHWLVWGPGEFMSQVNGEDGYLVGTCFWQMNDTWRQADGVQQLFRQNFEAEGETGLAAYEQYERQMGRWATNGMDVIFDGQRMGPKTWNPSPEQAAMVMGEGFEPVPGTNAMRYVQALMLLLNQTIVAVDDDDVPRPFRRRATRKGLPPKVSVIRLRRTESNSYPEGEEGAVEWQHQWIVRRHLRWQPKGPRKNVDHEHVYGPVEVDPMTKHLYRWCVHPECGNYLDRIVIEAYPKGPPGKPLIITDKVYSLDR